MKIGIVKTSYKKNENRVPIYPDHIHLINPSIKSKLFFEEGYGAAYGVDDSFFIEQKSHMASREELFETCDLIILPKPVENDLKLMKERQVLWGWPHCVQQTAITQIAIDRKLTLIAWEAMHHWSPKGEKLMHIFYKNNELAGYSAILHVLHLMGQDGFYGPRRKVAVIGYGSCSRGAIHALHGRGFNNIHVYTLRPTHLVANQHPDVYYHHLQRKIDGSLWAYDEASDLRPFIDLLSEADIICNCVLQDTENPMMFVGELEIQQLKTRTLIVDVSCDKGMGFFFARPTTFDDPVFTIGDNIWYYSVDHTPTYLWNAASREISKALLPYLPIICEGQNAWSQDATIRNAIEIQDGIVQNPKILSFQHRKHGYPHEITNSNIGI